MKFKVFSFGLLISVIFLTGCSSKKESIAPNIKNVEHFKDKVVIVDSLYEKERKSFLSQTMHTPKIPVKTPDKILRVLLMPYIDEDMNLQTENYHFIKVDEGRWILGEYLNGQERLSPKTLTPLKGN